MTPQPIAKLQEPWQSLARSRLCAETQPADPSPKPDILSPTCISRISADMGGPYEACKCERCRIKAELTALHAPIPLDHTTGELEELLNIVKATPIKPRKARAVSS